MSVGHSSANISGSVELINQETDNLRWANSDERACLYSWSGCARDAVADAPQNSMKGDSSLFTSVVIDFWMRSVL